MTKTEAQKEIDQLSRELGGKPLSVDWLDADANHPASIIARWGRIKVENIDFESSDAIEAEPKFALLYDRLVNAVRSCLYY
jgi:hypothetical protein